MTGTVQFESASMNAEICERTAKEKQLFIEQTVVLPLLGITWKLWRDAKIVEAYEDAPFGD